MQRVVNVYIRNGLASQYNAGDLMQEGTMALVRAAEKFQPVRRGSERGRASGKSGGSEAGERKSKRRSARKSARQSKRKSAGKSARKHLGQTPSDSPP